MQLALVGTLMIMGFMGSWHCAAMCGPLCGNFKNQSDFFLYQAGRLISYLFMGCILFMGTHYLLNVESRPIKVIASVIYGIFFILFGLLQLSLIKAKFVQVKYSILQFKLIQKNKDLVRKFPIFLGLLTGFFPCAWLFSFLFLSTRMASISHALLLIFIFWFTALPAFIAVTGFMQSLIKHSPISHQKISGMVMIVAGVFSIIGHWI